MMNLGRGVRAAFRCTLATAVAVLATAGPVSADSLVVQPDGKILLSGQTSPEFGALARLHPNGTLDAGFGQGGFVIDQRSTRFQGVALQPDGRILGVFGPGSMLVRYLPDGSPDPGFAGGAFGGTYEPGQSSASGLSALLVQPSGEIVIAGETRRDQAEAWVRRYDAGGALLETAGRVPPQGTEVFSIKLDDLLERPDGSLIGSGWTDSEDFDFLRPFLARFLPGSGLDFDPSFGGGAGLVRPNFPPDSSFSLHKRGLRALAQTGDNLLVAGASRGTFLLARFDAGGQLDPSFGEGGFVAPPIVGPGAKLSKGEGEEASSWAEDVAVVPDGDVLLGGGTSQWSTEWVSSKALPRHCRDCPQPLLARFDPSGRLDPSFGSGGIKRLLEPDGSFMRGSAWQVTPLADGKILVSGSVAVGGGLGSDPFVARLNPDGSYDPGFGDRGLVVLRFPCSHQSFKELRRTGCWPSALLTSSLRGLRRGRPSLSLGMAPNLPWAAIKGVTLTLPPGVQLAKKFRSRVRVTAVGGSGSGGRVSALKPGKRGRTLVFFSKFGEAKELRIKLRGGSLKTVGRHRLGRRALRLQMEVTFADATFRDGFESFQTLTRDVRSTG